jgi:hypothetical protein
MPRKVFLTQDNQEKIVTFKNHQCFQALGAYIRLAGVF